MAPPVPPSAWDPVVVDAALARVRAGEVDAYHAVVLAHERLVRAWLRGHAPAGIDADEIAQQAFITAFRLLSRFQAGTSFKAWLMAIVRHALLAELRRQRNARFTPLDALDAWEREQAAPEHMQEDLLERLERCLDRLPPDGRDLLRRHHGDGTSLAELAEDGARSLGALKFRLHWLRRRLADCVRGAPEAAP